MTTEYPMVWYEQMPFTSSLGLTFTDCGECAGTLLRITLHPRRKFLWVFDCNACGHEMAVTI